MIDKRKGDGMKEYKAGKLRYVYAATPLLYCAFSLIFRNRILAAFVVPRCVCGAAFEYLGAAYAVWVLCCLRKAMAGWKDDPAGHFAAELYPKPGSDQGLRAAPHDMGRAVLCVCIAAAEDVQQ